jgi:diacylglycerol kinase family enzyme
MYHLVINRLAGNNPESSLKLAKKLQRRLKRGHRECHLSVASTWEEYGSLVTSAVRGRPFAVVVFGGDGSVRLAASRAIRAKVLLGIVPCGRYNSIFTSIYGHGNPEAALDVVRSEYQRRIDAALANGHFFLGNLVSGLVPGMVSRIGQKKLPRLGMSWSKLASHAATDTAPRATIMKVDSYTFDAQPLILNIHMLSHLMTLRFAPAAIPDDGRVILIFDRSGDHDIVTRYIRDLKKDKYQYTDGMQMIRGQRIAISPVAGRVWLMDGDAVEFSGNELAIDVLHRALRIFSHATGKE